MCKIDDFKAAKRDVVEAKTWAEKIGDDKYYGGTSGKTCGHCLHERRRCTIFGHTPTDTYCDWFPRRFQAKATQ